MRSCGILLHISSLPSPYGIGTFGDDAKRFVDWVAGAGLKHWQILPLSPTGFGNSPYQSFSTFAGNPLLIDLDDLINLGLLDKQDCKQADFGKNPSLIDFEKVSHAKLSLLEKAFRRAATSDYDKFAQSEAFWLDDYALYMSIKESMGDKSWLEWDKDLLTRSESAIDKAKAQHKERIAFWKFVQYTFARQWRELREYANKNGVEIIGDLPIYVAVDSADVWANPALFRLDDNFKPTRVAGVPPDYFSSTGQLWGNPLYDWEKMKAENYHWWLSRIKKNLELYDCVRIDHFRAFDTYYTIPAAHNNAINGGWEVGPGMDLWNAVREELGEINVIAEDLGEIFESVRVLLKDSGFPGMKVLQFGFNGENNDNEHLPHRYPVGCVAYSGTHDNATFEGWYRHSTQNEKAMAKRYLKPRTFEPISKAAIRALFQSPADLTIIAMQDVLSLDNRARMNLPSTIGDNWIWRMKPGACKQKHAKFLKELCETYFR
ncbi:MAG: 4-alpha-glucanotransferase [Oscillospiraceae bacterium]|nr:4-alpha-glucanotransferase [Oscillospiraceae bacterium]